MSVKSLYEILLAIIGISSLAGLCIVIMVIAGLFV